MQAGNPAVRKETQPSFEINGIVPLAATNIIKTDPKGSGGRRLKNERMKNMSENEIRQIQKDIEIYEKAIENAEGALAEAERELNEALAEQLADDPTDTPE